MDNSLEEFSISDYGIFNEAIAAATQINESLSNSSIVLKECKTALDNESIFMGPVSDSCVAGFNKVDTKFEAETTNFKLIADYLIKAGTCYKSGDMSALDAILSIDGGTISSTNSGTGEVVTNGNVIDTTNPVGTGNKYNLPDDEVAFLAYVAMQEQGTVEGAKLELSLMANLYEMHKNEGYSSVTDYVLNSGWFANRSISDYQNPGSDYISVASQVMNDGVRYLPSNVVEHDCISDISNISTGNKGDRSNYIPGQTVINNEMGSRYMFVGFAPSGGDPFGYLV